jgi:hypothetical protein
MGLVKHYKYELKKISMMADPLSFNGLNGTNKPVLLF